MTLIPIAKIAAMAEVMAGLSLKNSKMPELESSSLAAEMSVSIRAHYGSLQVISTESITSESSLTLPIEETSL